jgi:hypothetical protein
MDWKRPKGAERLFPWSEVRAAVDAEDYAVAHHAQQYAHELLGGADCPRCATPAGQLRWVAIDKGEEVGWLTVCMQCEEQIEFLLDEELTRLRREGNW